MSKREEKETNGLIFIISLLIGLMYYLYQILI